MSRLLVGLALIGCLSASDITPDVLLKMYQQQDTDQLIKTSYMCYISGYYDAIIFSHADLTPAGTTAKDFGDCLGKWLLANPSVSKYMPSSMCVLMALQESGYLAKK